MLPLSVAACSTPERRIEIGAKPLERVPLDLPSVDPITLDEVEWILITPENAESVWQDLEKKNYDVVLFGLTDRGYENLSVNTAKIKQLVIQQKSVIAAYKRYYEQTESAIDRQQQDLEQQKKAAEQQPAEQSLMNKLRF